MAVTGAFLAVAAGAGSSLAAALQKREALRVDAPVLTILGRLARRPLWLVAMALDASSWGVLAAAMALAPIAVVLPLQGAGTALLVPIGIRLLGEKYHRHETLAILAVLAGAVAVTIAAAGLDAAKSALPGPALWAVAGVAILAAFLASRLKSGLACGATAGLLYAGTAIFTKEVGTRFADRGLAALASLALWPTAWAFLLIGLAALAFIHTGFRRSNAATVASVMMAIATALPVLCGFVLYGERIPQGAPGALLALGLVLSLAGMIALARIEAAPISTA
jgi:multidrug transporter EmrE-like cation transporter